MSHREITCIVNLTWFVVNIKRRVEERLFPHFGVYCN
jgi:hypothetical protein